MKLNIPFKTLMFGALLVAGQSLLAQTVDFESFSPGATTFTTGSGTFGLTGLEVARAGAFGSDESDQFLDTGFGSSSTGGTITASGAGMSFQLNTLDAWTSNNQGGIDQANVDVTFRGTLLGGGTISQTINVNPTGFSGLDWDETLTFDAAWSGQNLTSLQIIIESTANSADYIAIDDLQLDGITFPVEFSHFQAKPSGNDVSLSWVTASELNNRGFEIQRAQAGQAFETVGFVEGNGTISEESRYDFTHLNGMEGEQLSYRLRQIDFDGNQQFSQIVEVSFDADGQTSFSAFPNPCASDQVRIAYTTADSGPLALKLLSIDGRVLREESLQVSAGVSEVPFSMDEVPAGTYLLEAIQNGRRISQKVTKL